MTTQTIIDTAINLLKDVAVVMVVAYLVTRTDAYARVLDRTAAFRDRLLLMLIFGLFSIWGTVSGSQILGATANTRDLGPSMGGLTAGPFVGIGAGLIGAVQRFAEGGPTRWLCSLATVLIGVAAGIVYELNRRRFIGVLPAVIFMALAETAHMGLVFLLVHPFSYALDVVTHVYPPMLLSDCAGVAVFALIFTNRERERATATAKARIDTELATARAIQRGLLPRTDDLGLGGDAAAALSVAACLEPARDVGGDLYDLFALDDDRLCLVIGDVAGKGVAAGLFMSAADALVHAASTAGRPVDTVLEIVNKELWRRNDTLMFVTLLIGVVRLSTGELQYANAGHCPPLVRRRGGPVEELPAVRGSALGVDPSLTFEVGTARFATGDLLFLYTDGVTEATDAAGELFGDERLARSLEVVGDASPDEVVAGIMEDVGRFVGAAEQFDDIAMVVFRYEGKAGAGRETRPAPAHEGAPAGVRLPARLEEIARLAELVEAFARREDLGSTVAHNLALAAEEAFTNIVRHGLRHSSESWVDVYLSRERDEVQARFEDGGPAFDPRSAPQADVTGDLDERVPGGLGVHLMKTVCRRIEYERRDGRNVLTLALAVGGEGEG